MIIAKKKGQLEYGGYIAWVFFIVLSAIVMYIILTSVWGAKESVETSAPELIHKFPAVFVHTFLMLEISEEDSKKFFPNSKQIHYVKDLIYISTEESKEAVNNYKNDYLSSLYNQDPKGNTILDLYALYTNRIYFDRLLLKIEYDVEVLPSVISDYEMSGNEVEDEEINPNEFTKDLYSLNNMFDNINSPDTFSIQNNYFYYIKTKTGNFAVIFFEDPVGYEIEKEELNPLGD
jgi:hypothetical protein